MSATRTFGLVRSMRVAGALVLVAAAVAGCGSHHGSAPNLGNTSWSLASFQGSEAFMTPVVSGSVATLALKPDQKMSGSTGCNTFIGTYLFSTTRLTLNIGTRTLAPCVTSELTAQQAAITRQFPQVRSYRINGQVLVLSNEVGRELFTYNKGS